MKKILENPIVKQDIENVVSNNMIEWEMFAGKIVAVTGATGLLGRLTVLALLEADKKYQLGLKVIAFVRNIEKAQYIFQEVFCDALQFVYNDIRMPVDFSIKADYLIHGASVTASKMMVEMPVETIMTTVEGTCNILEFAKNNAMQGVVYLSSMEVYGVIDSNVFEVREKDLGYINPVNIRSSYSEGKRLAECLCTSYAKEYELPVKIARLAQTFGAGIDETENRVFAQFARSVLEGKDIVLRTKGDKANCYCYTSDAVAALLILLTRGESGEAYNIANMETFCSIKELAEVFIGAKKETKSRLTFDISEDVSKLGYAPSTILKLNTEKMTRLGWKPTVGILKMVQRLLESME